MESGDKGLDCLFDVCFVVGFVGFNEEQYLFIGVFGFWCMESYFEVSCVIFVVVLVCFWIGFFGVMFGVFEVEWLILVFVLI